MELDLNRKVQEAWKKTARAGKCILESRQFISESLKTALKLKTFGLYLMIVGVFISVGAVFTFRFSEYLPALLSKAGAEINPDGYKIIKVTLILITFIFCAFSAFLMFAGWWSFYYAKHYQIIFETTDMSIENSTEAVAEMKRVHRVQIWLALVSSVLLAALGAFTVTVILIRR